MTRVHSRSKDWLADIKAVAFDGYGTVIDFTEPDFIAAMAEICDAASRWMPTPPTSGSASSAPRIHFRSENHDQPIYRRYDDAWAIQFERVFKHLRLEADAWAAAMHLKQSLSDAPAFDEVPAVLDALRPHYRIALLSNADDDFLTACLARNSLEFDTIVTSEQAGAIKPDPAIFLHLARKLDLPPHQILYAGDNPVPDVLGPSRAGMLSAWVNRPGRRKPRNVPQPDIRVRSLSDLVPLLVPALTEPKEESATNPRRIRG